MKCDFVTDRFLKTGIIRIETAKQYMEAVLRQCFGKGEMDMAALHVTIDNFEQEVMQSDKPVLIDFWASWCGPCKMLMPVIEELAGEVTDAKICKVNVDEQPDLAAKYGVMSIPTLVVIKNGQTVNKTVGVQSKDAILKMLRG